MVAEAVAHRQPVSGLEALEILCLSSGKLSSFHHYIRRNWHGD
jgi:hypothetical protein